MMGERTVAQEALFYEFSLERHVPSNHLLRSIDRFVDLSGIRAHLRPFYSETGRPSIDPELMLRMLIVGYCFGIPFRTSVVRRGPPEPRGHVSTPFCVPLRIGSARTSSGFFACSTLAASADRMG